MSSQIARSVGIQAVAHHRIYNELGNPTPRPIYLIYGARLPVDTCICAVDCVLQLPSAIREHRFYNMSMWEAFKFTYQHAVLLLDEHEVAALDYPMIFAGVIQRSESTPDRPAVLTVQLA